MLSMREIQSHFLLQHSSGTARARSHAMEAIEEGLYSLDYWIGFHDGLHGFVGDSFEHIPKEKQPC